MCNFAILIRLIHCSIHREFELWKPKTCKYCKRYQNSLVGKNRCISSSHLKTPFVSRRCVFPLVFVFVSFILTSLCKCLSFRYASFYCLCLICVCVWCGTYAIRVNTQNATLSNCWMNEWVCFLQLLTCFRLLAKTKCVTFYYVVQDKRDWKGRPAYTLYK